MTDPPQFELPPWAVRRYGAIVCIECEADRGYGVGTASHLREAIAEFQHNPSCSLEPRKKRRVRPPPYRKEARYIQRVVVRIGTIGSVLDMMRYDSCYPATEDDSRRLERIATGSAKPHEHTVSFIRVGQNDSGPTVRRWQSYGCEVLDVKHPDD